MQSAGRALNAGAVPERVELATGDEELVFRDGVVAVAEEVDGSGAKGGMAGLAH